MRFFITYAALLLLVAACGTAGEPGSDTTTSTTEDTTTTVEDTTTTGVSVELPEGFSSSLLDEIVDDAAQRTDVSRTDVEVISVDAQTFNDAALGCPEPGKMYAQVLTPGFVVLIDAGGEELDYRVAERSGEFRVCE